MDVEDNSKPRVFTFSNLQKPLDQPTGAGPNKYWNYIIKSHGKELFMEAIQAHIDDLVIDPWDKEDLG